MHVFQTKNEIQVTCNWTIKLLYFVQQCLQLKCQRSSGKVNGGGGTASMRSVDKFIRWCCR